MCGFLFWQSDRALLYHPGCGAVVRSGLTATSTSQVQALGSASQVAGTIGMCHNDQLISVFFSRDGVSLYIGQPGLKLLTSVVPPFSVS